MNNRFFLLLVLIHILSGCSSLGPKFIPDEAYVFSKEQKTGIAILSLSANARCIGGLTMHYRKTDWRFSSRTMLVANRIWPGNMDNGLSYLYIQDLEPGQYEIIGFTRAGIVSNVKLSMKFNIKAGQIDYLGSIFMDVPDSCNSASISVSDKRHRDISKARELLPSIAYENIHYQILKRENN